MMSNSAQLCEKISDLNDIAPSSQPLIPGASDRKSSLLEAIKKVACKNQTGSVAQDRNQGLENSAVRRQASTTEILQEDITKPGNNKLPEITKSGLEELKKSMQEQLKNINDFDNESLCFDNDLLEDRLSASHVKGPWRDTKNMERQPSDGYVQATEIEHYEINKDQPVPRNMSANTDQQSDSSYVTGIPGPKTTFPLLQEAMASLRETHCQDSGYVPESVMQNILHRSDAWKHETSGYVELPRVTGIGRDNTHTQYVPHSLMNEFDKCSITEPLKENMHCSQLAQTINDTQDNYVSHNEKDWPSYQPPRQNQDSRLQNEFDNSCTNCANHNLKEYIPESSQALHDQYVSHIVHPSWKQVFENRPQQIAPEIHEYQIPPEDFDYSNRFSVDWMQGLQNRARCKAGNSINQHFYQEENGQYAGSQGHMMMADHPYRFCGQQMHQHSQGGDKWQNHIRTDARQNFTNQDYVRPGVFDDSYSAPQIFQSNNFRSAHGSHDGSSAGAGANVPYSMQSNHQEVLYHRDYIRPQCQRFNSQNSDYSHVSDKSDSVLSADDNLAYETSWSDPSSYVSLKQLNKYESDRHTSDCVSNISERQKPAGASCMSLELDKPGTSQCDSSEERQCKNASPAGFIQALNVEGSLQKEYDSFEPIPPDDDQSPKGSINDLMDEMEIFNSR